jgi:uncharacterized membrane protein YhiD involved in acid resistance
MKQGLSVTGLNTAVTLWATAAVGALAGAAALPGGDHRRGDHRRC